MMLRLILLLSFFFNIISALEIDEKKTFENLLTNSKIYSDKIQQDKLFYIRSSKENLNPIFPITLEHHNFKNFYKYNINHQFFLTIFFGIMGIIILYNFLIYWGTREISYFYYILFFFSVLMYQLLYRSVINYTEMSMIIESFFLSFLLANKIKQLNSEKVILEENLIFHKTKEKKRLSWMIEEETKALKISLKEKELLLKELNHRVKNSIQTIVSFLRLQIDEIEEKKTQQILVNIENRILSISHLYALLYTKENICFVNTHEYFTLLIEDIETSYAMPHIKIELQTEVNLSSEYAIYCGFILHESITNSLQHAFVGRDSGEIQIHLKKEDDLYRLSLYDNGIGYNKNNNSDSLGLVIIETLVLTQLKGSLSIDSIDGTKIEIEWRENG